MESGAAPTTRAKGKDGPESNINGFSWATRPGRGGRSRENGTTETYISAATIDMLFPLVARAGKGDAASLDIHQ